jgi:hypothetical protein
LFVFFDDDERREEEKKVCRVQFQLSFNQKQISLFSLTGSSEWMAYKLKVEIIKGKKITQKSLNELFFPVARRTFK